MIEAKTGIDRIEIYADGSISVRFAKLVLNDGVVAATEYHRASAEPGVDFAKLESSVATHLKALGYDPPPSDDWKKISDHSVVAWTPEVVQAFDDRRAAAALAAAGADAAPVPMPAVTFTPVP